MEAPYMVRGRAGPEFQIRLPQDLRTATGVAALRVRLPHQGRRGLRDEALKRAGVAKALFEGLRRMDRDKLKTLSRAELQAMLSDAIQGLNAAWDVPPETDKTESVARAADKLAAIGSELFGRPSPMPDLASREDMRWFALSVALSRARDEGRPLITADTDDLLARLLQSHLARPGRTAMPAPSEQPMLGACNRHPSRQPPGCPESQCPRPQGLTSARIQNQRCRLHHLPTLQQAGGSIPSQLHSMHTDRISGREQAPTTIIFGRSTCGSRCSLRSMAISMSVRSLTLYCASSVTPCRSCPQRPPGTLHGLQKRSLGSCGGMDTGRGKSAKAGGSEDRLAVHQRDHSRRQDREHCQDCGELSLR